MSAIHFERSTRASGVRAKNEKRVLDQESVHFSIAYAHRERAAARGGAVSAGSAAPPIRKPPMHAGARHRVPNDCANYVVELELDVQPHASVVAGAPQKR